MKVGTSRIFRMLSYVDTFMLARIVPMTRSMYIGFFGNPALWREHGKDLWTERYRQAHDEVRRSVSESRRLEYKLGSGWEPLCDFLGVSVPQEPFPNVNESADFDDLMYDLKRLAVIRVVKSWLPTFIGAFLAASFGYCCIISA